MTSVEADPPHIQKRLLSSDWVVFVVVSATIIGVVLETGIIRVSGFEDVLDVNTDVKIFVGLAILSIVSQLTILNFVHMRVGKSFLSLKILHLHIVNKVILIVQLGIIALLLLILLEVTLAFSYDLILVKAAFMSSFLTAACMTALLSSRFIIWLKSNKNRLILAYLLASLFISLSAITGIVYISDQLSYNPDVVRPKSSSDFVFHVERGRSSLAYPYTIFSAFTFVLLWIGTVFLLQSYRKRLGTIKYWIIMSIPLLYFLGQFQPQVLDVIFSYTSSNPTFFSIAYVMIVDASRPVGSIVFGLAFIQVARKIQNQEVKGYIVISGIGLLLLLVSYQAQALITAPFPPLGLLSASFFGLSSYLILIGIYSSAVSVSQDSRLRVSIRRSVETEVNFIGSIGDAEMDHTIQEKVLKTTRTISDVMPQETGVASSLTEKEIKEYIEQVLEETLKKQS